MGIRFAEFDEAGTESRTRISFLFSLSRKKVNIL